MNPFPSRPHMGPGNTIAPFPDPDNPMDNVWRSHDMKYSEVLAEGRNPYTHSSWETDGAYAKYALQQWVKSPYSNLPELAAAIGLGSKYAIQPTLGKRRVREDDTEYNTPPQRGRYNPRAPPDLPSNIPPLARQLILQKKMPYYRRRRVTRRRRRKYTRRPKASIPRYMKAYFDQMNPKKQGRMQAMITWTTALENQQGWGYVDNEVQALTKTNLDLIMKYTEDVSTADISTLEPRNFYINSLSYNHRFHNPGNNDIVVKVYEFTSVTDNMDSPITLMNTFMANTDINPATAGTYRIQANSTDLTFKLGDIKSVFKDFYKVKHLKSMRLGPSHADSVSVIYKNRHVGPRFNRPTFGGVGTQSLYPKGSTFIMFSYVGTQETNAAGDVVYPQAAVAVHSKGKFTCRDTFINETGTKTKVIGTIYGSETLGIGPARSYAYVNAAANILPVPT